MAVTLTDRRVNVSEADSVTGWTGAGFGTTTADIVEAPSAVAASISIGDQSVYFTSASASDLTGKLVYVYSFNNALQNVWDNTIPPNAILIGDGTNRIAFHQAGSNRRVFNHFDGPTNWQSLVIDTDKLTELDTAGLSFADAGNFASLNTGSITDFGAYFETLSKALGGGYNVAVDIIRYGNDGIYITGGGVGTEGNFSEIAEADRSTVTGTAHGLVRELNPSAFGSQGPLTFGRSDTATNSYFLDSNKSITYENRSIADGKYYFRVEGNVSSTNYFNLSNSSIASAGPSLSVSCSQNINELFFDGVSFIDLREKIFFPTDTETNSATHSITDCSFTNTDSVNPGSTTFSNNTFNNYSGTEGYVTIDSNSITTNWSDLRFTSAGSDHALYITATGNYTLNNFTYTNYASTDGSTGNEVLYNNSGGPVTASVVGGQIPTVRNGTGASTLVVQNTDVTLTGLKENTEVRIIASGSNIELDGIENAVDGTFDNRSFTFTLQGNTEVEIVIANLEYIFQRFVYTVPLSNTSVPIQQIIDRNYSNPPGP